LNRVVFTAGAATLALALGCRPPSPEEASHNTLKMGWAAYKGLYMQSGRVVDPSRGGGQSTSEGQGYAMLRAAWMRDRKTFSEAFGWAEQHLRRPDGLYSWLWTPAEGGHVSDANTASDADQEIALALIIGSHVFDDPQLLGRAQQLLHAIRANERMDIADGWFPAAGNWAASRRILNLSYFVPYAYPYFARVDSDGRWNGVTEQGYELIAKARQRTRLIPDFMAVNTAGEIVSLPADSGLSADFSSDAMRIYWRVAVDCELHHQPKACADPLGADQLTSMLVRDGALFTRYALDGSPLERVESYSFYGAALPYLALNAPPTEHALEARQLSARVVWRVLSEPNRYFDANWVWFGLAALNGTVKNSMDFVQKDAPLSGQRSH
jgi:endo-1,4-beta-D-glucanase Y